MQKASEEKFKQYPNPIFQAETFHSHYKKWEKSVGNDTLDEEGITEEAMRQTCETICTKFPRGTDCGCLLWEPIVDDTPLEGRGVSMRWLSHVWAWMRNILNCEGPIIPTRLFVTLFIESFVLSTPTEQTDPLKQGANPLYYFVPVKFRGKPQVFLSHGWDSWLRHLLYLPPTSEPGQIASKIGSQKTFLWLDIFAIVQDPGSPKQQSQVSNIGKVIQSIGKTCIIVPGHGSVHFVLLPARRSWCCLEIAYTKHLSARVGLNKAFFATPGVYDSSKNMGFHKCLISDICRLECAGAETSDEGERKAIHDLLDRELGMEQADRLVRKAILQAFHERYNAEEYSSRAGRIARMYREALESLEEACGGCGAEIGRVKQKRKREHEGVDDWDKTPTASDKCKTGKGGPSTIRRDFES